MKYADATKWGTTHAVVSLTVPRNTPQGSVLLRGARESSTANNVMVVIKLLALGLFVADDRPYILKSPRDPVHRAFADAQFPGDIAESQALITSGDDVEDLKSLFYSWSLIH